jgi:hypothetical protein
MFLFFQIYRPNHALKGKKILELSLKSGGGRKSSQLSFRDVLQCPHERLESEKANVPAVAPATEGSVSCHPFTVIALPEQSV